MRFETIKDRCILIFWILPLSVLFILFCLITRRKSSTVKYKNGTIIIIFNIFENEKYFGHVRINGNTIFLKNSSFKRKMIAQGKRIIDAKQ